MPWIFFLLALGCFAIVTKTQSIGLAFICLLAALGLMVAGTLGLLANRIQGRAQHPGTLLSGPELVAARKQAAEAKARANANAGDAGSTSSSRRDEPDGDSGGDAAAGDGGGD